MTHPPPEPHIATLRERTRRWGWIGIWLVWASFLGGAAATFLVVHLTLALGSVPHGAHIRPMGLALFTGLAALGGLTVGVLIAVAGAILCVRARRWFGIPLGVLAVAVNLLPWPVSQHLVQRIVQERHLVMEP